MPAPGLLVQDISATPLAREDVAAGRSPTRTWSKTKGRAILTVADGFSDEHDGVGADEVQVSLPMMQVRNTGEQAAAAPARLRKVFGPLRSVSRTGVVCPPQD